MLCVNISYIGIVTVKDVGYRQIIHGSKSEAINLLKNPVLENRLVYVKMQTKEIIIKNQIYNCCLNNLLKAKTENILTDEKKRSGDLFYKIS